MHDNMKDVIEKRFIYMGEHQRWLTQGVVVEIYLRLAGGWHIWTYMGWLKDI